ncbi:hypothetical protein [Bacteriovorax sp. Seq25_V]|uniref:hypothetical protein n=1 Tax=Bacteriovorax sp. Seq25_V TaxID=1201288 RepID=UPI000389EC71|nr:hypothetical protein [Bacteriovorax sp. Seq25_V]EQC43778.1 hypothetical protein M900_1459 [Bacteriovorax sp. Seq25_V]
MKKMILLAMMALSFTTFAGTVNPGLVKICYKQAAEACYGLVGDQLADCMNEEVNTCIDNYSSPFAVDFFVHPKVCAMQAKAECKGYQGEEYKQCVDGIIALCEMDYSSVNKSVPQCVEQCGMIGSEEMRKLCFQTCEVL